MVQPASGSSEDTCQDCPECGSKLTVSTIRSNRGTYCRCHACGNMWHQDADAEAPQTVKV